MALKNLARPVLVLVVVVGIMVLMVRGTTRMVAPGLRPAGDSVTAALNSVGIARPREDTLLMVIYVSPTCPHCHVYLARLDSLTRAGPALGKARLVVLASDSMIPHEDRPNISWAVDSSRRFKHLLEIRGTPEALLIDSDGTVLGSWPGAVGHPTLLLDTLKNRLSISRRESPE